MKVYVVTSEYGAYSDMGYDVEGVFATRENAVKYVESRFLVVYHYHYVETKDFGWTRTVDRWSEYCAEDEYGTHETRHEPDKTARVYPKTKDGTTFSYDRFPDGSKINNYYLNDYFISEFELVE